MKNIRHRLEKGFEQFALTIFRHRIKTTVFMFAAVAALLLQIPKITIDTSTEGFLHQKDPALLAYNEFRDRFGRDEVIIIAIKPPEVFNRKFLKKLKTLHEDLEENVPFIDDITSLVNARNTRGEADELIVEDLLEKWPETRSDMERLKNRVLGNQIFKNMLISEDGAFTTIIIKTNSYSSSGGEVENLEGFKEEFQKTPADRELDSEKQRYLTDVENTQVIMAVHQILEKYIDPEFPVFLAGSPVVTHFLKRSMMHDIRKFMALSVLTISTILFIMFKRISGVILPLTIVLSSLSSTIGIMAVAGVPIKVPTQILPSFLMAVCVGASVHILAIFYQRYQKSMNKKEAIVHAIGHSGLPVVMTSVTTAAGLLSFSTAEVAPISDIGIYAGMGVMLSLGYTLVLLPALLSLTPIKPKPLKKAIDPKKGIITRFLDVVADFSTRYPRWILGISVIIMTTSIILATGIRFSHHVLGWFPVHNPIRTATETIDRELRGSLSLEVIIDTGKENGLYDPQILNRLERAAAYFESLALEDIFVGKAWSLTTLVKEINQALNENRPQFYAIPQNRDLVAQELLLFENSGSDDLEDFVDSQFSMARFTIKAPFKDAIKYNKLLKIASHYFTENFPEANVVLTGMMPLLSRTISNAIVSMAKSYIIALCVITALMIILIGRIRIGLLSMVPNLAPIMLTLGMMRVFSIPMDLFTLMVGSIAIGLAVDDTIHFMHHFRRNYESSGNPVVAVRQTLQTTGRAMLVTSIVLSIGFFIFTFASMNNLKNFGILTAFTILMALLADYLIAPALMVLVNKKGVGWPPNALP